MQEFDRCVGMLLALLASSIQGFDKGHLECRVIEDKSLLVHIPSLQCRHNEGAVPSAAIVKLNTCPNRFTHTLTAAKSGRMRTK